MEHLPGWLRQHVAALRMLIVLTVILGGLYPLAVTGIVQLPGLQGRADGSSISDTSGKEVGSRLIGQSFLDAHGKPIAKYFQSRPSAAGDGYDPTASGASNLGPENIVDTLPDPRVAGDAGTQSLLTQVCTRSVEIGKFDGVDGVDGSRPYCTPDGVGSVLSIIHRHGTVGPIMTVVSVNQACPDKPFVASYRGVTVQCARPGADYSHGEIVPVRGAAPAHPAVPPDAVTASGSGLDPQISPAYASIQVDRVAAARHLDPAYVRALVHKYTQGRALGFMGEPGVNVLQLNLALDAASS